MVRKVPEVREGRYDRPDMIYDFDEGIAPELQVGHKYLFVARYGNHGMYYSKITELKEEPGPL